MPTLEQERSADVWTHVKTGCSKDYVNVAKALPGLIMNSGLMQTLAFMEQKKKDQAYEQVARQLRTWLWRRQLPKGSTKAVQDPGFVDFMNHLTQADSQTQRELVTEALAWLKWLRQLAAAQQRHDAAGG